MRDVSKYIDHSVHSKRANFIARTLASSTMVPGFESLDLGRRGSLRLRHPTVRLLAAEELVFAYGRYAEGYSGE